MEAPRRRRKRQEGYFEHTAIGDRTQDHSLATFILNPLFFFFKKYNTRCLRRDIYILRRDYMKTYKKDDIDITDDEL